MYLLIDLGMNDFWHVDLLSLCGLSQTPAVEMTGFFLGTVHESVFVVAVHISPVHGVSVDSLNKPGH